LESTPKFTAQSTASTSEKSNSNGAAGLNLEARYRVVILGGGIHGVGIAHDLASRGWKDVLVVEKSIIGSGTSSKSTKLIHGGLRYLQNPRDFPLVAEGLEERALLSILAPDIVKALPFIFPVMKKGGMPRFMIKIGLWLYDTLSHGRSMGRHVWMSPEEALKEAPILDKKVFKGFYKFFDGQTDDLALVHRVAKSATQLGVTISERTKALSIKHEAIGWNIELQSGEETKSVTAKYVVNAMGPWAHEIFKASNIRPKVEGINNQGTHLLVRDLGLTTGLFLQSPADGRIFFVLPWEGLTLIGTTEDDFTGNPDDCRAQPEQIEYLIQRCNQFLSVKLTKNDVIKTFSGMRWLAKDSHSGLSATSRTHLITRHEHGSDLLFTIYGGKLTAYRALAKEIGSAIAKAFGDTTPSKTDQSAMWATADQMPEELMVPQRFSNE
jgi:glycerol-3-phosphate dehydrogenase